MQRRRAESRPSLRSIYHFARFSLDEESGELRCAGAVVPIHRKPLQLLCCLIRNRERTMTSRELLEAVWPQTSVSLWALSSALRDLRRALNDHDPSQPIIGTSRGHGYRLQVEVTESPRQRERHHEATPPTPSRPAEARSAESLELLRDSLLLRVRVLPQAQLVAVASLLGVNADGCGSDSGVRPFPRPAATAERQPRAGTPLRTGPR